MSRKNTPNRLAFGGICAAVMALIVCYYYIMYAYREEQQRVKDKLTSGERTVYKDE